MKKFVVLFAAVFLLAAEVNATLVSNFSDIQNWAGDGASATNRAALVIQWNIGTIHHSIAWGYGWNSGTRTGWDMLTAIDLADVRLTLVPNGSSVFGIFYDLDNDGGSFTAGTPGVYGVTNDTDGSTSDAGDVYQSGWVSSGYWEYSVFGGNFSYDIYDMNPPYDYLGSSTYNVAGNSDYSSVVWFSSPLGSSARELINGSWDAYSYAPVFALQTIQQPLAAVPEANSSALLLFAAVAFIFHARKGLHTR